MRREIGRRHGWWCLAAPWPAVDAIALSIGSTVDGGQRMRRLIPRHPEAQKISPGVSIDRHVGLHVEMCLHRLPNASGQTLPFRRTTVFGRATGGDDWLMTKRFSMPATLPGAVRRFDLRNSDGKSRRALESRRESKSEANVAVVSRGLGGCTVPGKSKSCATSAGDVRRHRYSGFQRAYGCNCGHSMSSSLIERWRQNTGGLDSRQACRRS